ncbi:helix-turn-helix transcriptional regulator [Mycobacteroides abscessus]|uniref:helix-turn-helix domain-containing protein n=1 Tax=Mycobacteroides abscessus TaxID=36809 RepID=UPI0002DC70A6|nr:helix-turn-helix transcriptional regulator [Mycobacteroides abscessus]AMU73686.1 transcriptional regulator [Mycobacteroides abscessus]ANO22625.1 transcriptional regulator [Mycobacteroides abscessus]MCU8694016.1 helix-turn-helix transcriptional regulator [Mycobacteroides abscessus]MCU8713224.1 helix-turn-helix transcriptional regulator [Mycobacteroides abscessus]MCU8717969.1 helix-turn-helix transcriptional regulator [Mycobacteroides abscessus]
MATNDQDVALLQQVIAAELRAARARTGRTQEEVADLTGYHRSTVNRLLGGTRKVDVLQLIDLARALDTTAGEILDAAQREYERKKRAGANTD